MAVFSMQGPIGAALIAAGLTFGSVSRTEERADLPGGLTEPYNWHQDSANLVKNPSFEERDESGKPAGWKLLPNFRVVEGEARRGSASLLLTDGHLGKGFPTAVQTLELTPGWYYLSGWIKAQEAGTNTRGAGGRIEIGGRGARGATRVVKGTTDWTKVEREKLALPGGSTQVRLYAYRKPNGSLYFDDVELKRLMAPPVEGFLLYPNYRGLLFPDGPQRIRVAVVLRPEELQLGLEAFRVRLSLFREGPDGSEEKHAAVLTKEIVPESSELEAELDGSALTAGAYLLKLEALGRDDGRTIAQYPAYRIVKIAANGMDPFRTYVDEDNVLVLDGERKFALGIYNTGGYSGTKRSYRRLVSKLAEAPLDLYINYWLGGANYETVAALSGALGEQRIHYLHSVNSWYRDNPHWSSVPPCSGAKESAAADEYAYAACRVRELESIPGLAGWYTADEQPVSRAERVFRQYRQIVGQDRDGITFIAQNRLRELEHWRDATDVMGVDIYPIQHVAEGQLSPLEMVFDGVAAANEAVRSSRPVWAVIQFFPFGRRGHWPTEPELRTMSYMAIVAGAKGLFYWSYGAKGLAWVKDPERKEELWQRLVRVTNEIKSLEPALLERDALEVLEAGGSSTGPIRVLAKEHDGERFIIAVNRSREKLTEEFRLARPATSLSVVGEERAIPLEGSRSFRDSFEAYATHVYRVSPAASDARP